jgi:hypothetical protein
VLECGENNTPIYQCVYTLDTFFPDLPRMVSCTAVNADQECRFDTATITLVKGWLIFVILHAMLWLCHVFTDWQVM